MIYRRYTFYILLVIWCGIIFYLSHQVADVSKVNSRTIVEYVVSNASESEIININNVFRECMHSFVFFILGIISYVTFKFDFKNVFVYSLLFCLIYALTDEVHQLFIDGRAFEFIDLVLDSFGSLFGISLIQFVINKFNFKGFWFVEK